MADQANARDRDFTYRQQESSQERAMRRQAFGADQAYREWQMLQAEEQSKQQQATWAKNREKLDMELTGAKEQAERDRALREEGFGPLIAAHFKGVPANIAKQTFDKKGKLRLNNYKWDPDQNALIIDVVDEESGEPAPVTIPEQVYAAVLKNGYGWDYNPVGSGKQERQSTDVAKLAVGQRALQEMATDLAERKKDLQGKIKAKAGEWTTTKAGANRLFADEISSLQALEAQYEELSSKFRGKALAMNGLAEETPPVSGSKLKPMTPEIAAKIRAEALKQPTGQRKQYAIDLAVKLGYDPNI
jgi:hypothetical protein